MDRQRERETLRGSCFVSVPSSEMELTSADFVTLGGRLLQRWS